jgi:hypothetical protein
MTRVLMIDGNRALTESVGLQCLEHGMAVRMTDPFVTASARCSRRRCRW